MRHINTELIIYYLEAEYFALIISSMRKILLSGYAIEAYVVARHVDSPESF